MEKYSEESSDDENFDSDLLIRNFEEEAQLLIHNLLPKKSKDKYIKTYDDFMSWRKANHDASPTENVMLVYFEELSSKLKPSSLWSIWSKLRATLSIKENIDLSKYKKLKVYLTNKNKGYKPKKSKTLSLSQIDTFLETAQDNIYLAIKSILVVGFFGCLRCQEILNLKLSDFEDTGKQFIITIAETKTDISRNFVISNKYYNIVKKYSLLRPNDLLNSDRFFVNYQKEKCTKQFIGKNKISEIPSIIASYLNLPETEKYTGHCYRRSSATALSNAGGNLLLLKQHGGWKSDSVAQGYVDFSTANKTKIFNMITDSSKAMNTHFTNHPPINILSTSKGKQVTNKKNENMPTNLVCEPSISDNETGSNDIYSNANENISPNMIIDESHFLQGNNLNALKNTDKQLKRNMCDKNQKIGEPLSKKLQSNIMPKTNSEALFQHCEIQNVNINNNYYCSCHKNT